ncbi:MAG: LysR family transcriptional regulator [Loktanella sp.]|nr:LysR family transcriptional regulator [Loktanella sp.]
MKSILLKLNAIRAFDAAGRKGSLTAAAEEMNVSHPSIGRHVRELEHALGVSLFKRSHQGMKLTRAGREFLKRVSPALQEIVDAADYVSSAGYNHIVVNCEPAFGLKWLVPNLGRFEAQHRDIDITIISSRDLIDLGMFEADLAIRYSRTRLVGPVELISDSPMHPYGAPGSIEDPSPEKIARQPLIFEENKDYWLDWFRHAGVADYEPPKRFKMLTIEMAIEASCSGYGIILSSGELVHEEMLRGRLERISDIGCKNGSYYLVRREDALKKNAIGLFRDWLLSETAIFRDTNASHSINTITREGESN